MHGLRYASRLEGGSGEGEETYRMQVRGTEARKGKQKCWCHCLWAKFY